MGTVGRSTVLRQSQFGGCARRAERRSAESPIDRHRQHAAGVLDRPGLFGSHGREVHRRRAAAGAIPVLALYGIPHRDCGSFAAGGMGTADDYRAWIDGIAAGVGASRAAIVVEPMRSRWPTACRVTNAKHATT